MDQKIIPITVKTNILFLKFYEYLIFNLGSVHFLTSSKAK